MNALVPLLRSAAQVALSLRERKAPLLLVLLPLLLFLHPVAAQAQTPLAHVNFAYPAENTVGVGREDNGSITVVVSLMYAPAQDASVQWTLSDGTAKGGTDFKGTGGTLTFTKGTTQLTQTITIETINNGSADGVRYGWIELSNPTGCILDMIQNKGKFYIYDDDAPITASFGAATYSIGEKGMKVDVQVKLSAACPNTVKVEWTSAGEGDNPAKSPQHYYPASGYVEFKPGDTSKTVSINILDNSNSDMDRKAKFSLGAVTGGPGVGAPDSATLTIVDDESPPAKIQFSAAAFSAQETAGYALITVNLDKAAAALVSVNYQTANDTAKAGVHYSAVFGAMQFQPGETSKTFQVPLTYQAAAEGDRTVNLSLSFPSNNAIVVSPASTVLTITEVPLVLSLREVTFWNHHVVYANDGDQGPYQGPHWLDGNGNGDLADAGDRSHPVCYTRNTKMQVSAKFAATSPVPVQGYVWIKGTGPNDPYGKSLSFPEVQISLTNLEAYMGLTVASNPFQDEVGSYQPLSIFWSFSVDNKATWVAAGTSQNEVFVTLAAPIATPYYGLLDLSCAVAQGQKEESTVFEYGWKCFEKKNIMVRTSLNSKLAAMENDDKSPRTGSSQPL
jgi:hypothetical protein